MKTRNNTQKANRGCAFAKALADILIKGCDSSLKEDFEQAVKKQLKITSRHLGITITPFQSFVLAAMADFGKPCAIQYVVQKAGINNLYVLSHYQEIMELVLIGALDFDREPGEDDCTFSLSERLLTSITLDTEFDGLNDSNLSLQNLLGSMNYWISIRTYNYMNFENFNWLVETLMKRVKEGKGSAASFCRKFLSYPLDNFERILLLMAIVNESQKLEDGAVSEKDLMRVLDNPKDAKLTINAFLSGKGNLPETGLLMHCRTNCDHNRATNHLFQITNKAIKELLPAYDMLSDAQISEYNRSLKERLAKGKQSPDQEDEFFDITSWEKIESHELFFNEDTHRQYEELHALLEDRSFKAIQKRMTEEHMKPGLAILMSGVPGVGKTQACLELAKATHRDVMRVNLSSVRDKYYGETEKHMKSLFDNYQKMADLARKDNRPIPILLLDECDALLYKRTTQVEHGSELTNNALQNIALQAIADLEGILIATTNLAVNLDDALDRRFLFKMQIDKPDVEVKKRIWKSMLPEINDDDIASLSRDFDFTGGQIYNIKRHCIIEKVLHDTVPDITRLQEYCRTEQFNKKTSRTTAIGFHQFK
jgi:hypothetical protein